MREDRRSARAGRRKQPGPARVGWIVDAQVDFMDPAGRLYVRNLFDDSDPGAATIVPTLAAVVAWMRRECEAVVYTGDWHGLDDPEIDAEHPDPGGGTYPPHCMGRSPDPEERAGAEVIDAIRPAAGEAVVLAHDAADLDARAAAEVAVAEGRPLFVRKTRFDVFEGNPAADALVRALRDALRGPVEFIVVGVARDVCVTQAVDGLQDRGHRVAAVSDATWGLGLEDEEATLARWARRGRVVAARELLGDFGPAGQ